jgi:DNA-binding NarL/FixJ family response regulator
VAGCGHEVAAVGSAGDLPAAVGGHQPDVTVADVRMPPGCTDEGLRAAIAIRRGHPAAGVLVFSQCTETRCTAGLTGASPGSGAAGVGYLLKDRVAGVEEFVAALSRVAAGGTALDPEVVRMRLVTELRRPSPLGRGLQIGRTPALASGPPMRRQFAAPRAAVVRSVPRLTLAFVRSSCQVSMTFVRSWFRLTLSFVRFCC